MNKKITVLHVLASRTYNGAENVVCQIKKMFKENEDIAIVYCSLDGPIREALKENEVTFKALKEMSVKEIKRIVKEVNPDIIHAHDMKAGFFSALACGRIPLISHIHNNNFDSRKVSLKSILFLYTAFKAKHIFWVSNSSYEGYCFKSIVKNKSEILYNVIDVNSLYDKIKLDKNEYNYDAVYLGRLAYPKNPQRIVEVFHKAVKKNESFQAAIIGEGEDADDIKKMICNYHLQNNIHCLGFLNNPYKILGSSKLLLMTSLWEGTPMCALEALSLGIPVVSTPVDGLCDLIENGTSGYLSNDDEELAQFCLNIADDDILQKKLSKGAKEKVASIMNIEKYKKRIYETYLSVYERK